MTWDWPDSLTPSNVAWGLQKAGVQHRSPMAGTVESIEFPGAWWRVSVTLPARKMTAGGEAEAFFARLAGGAERVRVPYWARLAPLGTMRGSNLTLPAARGDLTLSMFTAGTLLAGDMIGVGNQMFQVFQDCTALAGTLTVPLVNRVRAPIAAGSVVIWDRPTIECFVPSMSSARSYARGAAAELPVDLEEAP